MSIDARIASVAERDGILTLRLRAYRASDGVMSIRGARELYVRQWRKRPVAGQKIWGGSGNCIVEAGNGGERIEYERNGYDLVEKELQSQ